MKNAWCWGMFAMLVSAGVAADLPEPLKGVVDAYQACASQVRNAKENATLADIKGGCGSQDNAVRQVVPDNIRDQFMNDLYLRLEAGAAI